MRYFIIIIVLFLTGLANPAEAQLKLAVPFQPQIYYGTDSKSIVYELHLMDSLKRPVEFLGFKINSGYKILINDTIYEQIPKRKEKNRYVKYIWIDIDTVPDKLIHEINYKIGEESYKLTKIITDISDVKLTIGFPVRKGIWYMQAAPSPASYHRATTISSKSKYDTIQAGFILGHCNQRFAIDFAKVDNKGLLYKNEGHKNSEHNCYGEDVIAVSDGVVVGLLDSIKEHPSPPIISEKHGFRDFTGNMVLLDIGNGIIASYAHLIPNSIAVNVGDTLEKGDLIGRIGNSGSSTAPHLHFHLSKPDYNKVDSTDIFGIFWTSEGVSFVFDDYDNYPIISGKFIERETDYLSEPFKLDKPKAVTKSLPYENDVIKID